MHERQACAKKSHRPCAFHHSLPCQTDGVGKEHDILVPSVVFVHTAEQVLGGNGRGRSQKGALRLCIAFTFIVSPSCSTPSSLHLSTVQDSAWSGGKTRTGRCRIKRKRTHDTPSGESQIRWCLRQRGREGAKRRKDASMEGSQRHLPKPTVLVVYPFGLGKIGSVENSSQGLFLALRGIRFSSPKHTDFHVQAR